MAQPQRTELREFIVDHFDRNDFNLFCSDYFRDFYQDYEGTNEALSGLAERLVKHCVNRDELPRLRAGLQKKREKSYRAKFGYEQFAAVKTKPRDPRQVFLSYSSKDLAQAQRLAQDLREAGLRVWFAHDSLQPNEKWEPAIERGLKESGAFVVMLTPNSMQSEWVRDETNYALAQEKKGNYTFHSLLFETCDVDTLSIWVSQRQHIGFEGDYANGLERLCRALGVQSVASQRQQAEAARRAKQAEVDVLQRENERLKREADARTTEEAFARERKRLREENERLVREAKANAAVPKLATPTQKPVSRRAVLVGLVGLAGAGAVGTALGTALWNSRGAQPPPSIIVPTTVPTAPAASEATSKPQPTVTLPDMLPSVMPEAQPTATIIPESTSTPQSADPLILQLASGTTMQFVRVPAGEFWMGSDKAKDSNAQDDELPQHRVYLDEYLIGKYEVTNAQYAAFAAASKIKFEIPAGKENHPVVNISWYDAIAFCTFASQHSGQKIGLPTEAQWEKAARGTDGRIYPWGNKFDANKANTAESGKYDTTPVGAYSPQGDSPYGIADMCGNVWEWCADWYDANAYKNLPDGSIKNPTGPTTGVTRVVRGGSWFNNYNYARCAIRYSSAPDSRLYYLGFRLFSVLSPSQ